MEFKPSTIFLQDSLCVPKSKKCVSAEKLIFLFFFSRYPTFYYKMIAQVNRRDILLNMWGNRHMTGKALFDFIMNDRIKEDPVRKGYIFETIFAFLVVLSCLPNITYTEIIEDVFNNNKKIENINTILNLNITGQKGDSDFTFKNGDTTIPFSCKYSNGYLEDTGISQLYVRTPDITSDFKVGLVVKDKIVYTNHRYIDQKNKKKVFIDKTIADGLLLDETDIIRGLDFFCERFRENTMNMDQFIEHINTNYLGCPRKQLEKRMHQQMTVLQVFGLLCFGIVSLIFCIYHKMRSGKSITVLLICKMLLQVFSYKKILIMTAIPSTISDYTKALDTYLDFIGIKYLTQEDFDKLDDNFCGIFFCSIHYLKMDGEKMNKTEMLKKIKFDVVFSDEARIGSTTVKTKKRILDIDLDMNDVYKGIQLKFFVDGTADKVIKSFSIPNKHISKWEIEDECAMKQLNACKEEEKEPILQMMNKRHGKTFLECYHDPTLNKDYSKCPIQVLMKHRIPDQLIKEIDVYNLKHGTNYGYDMASLFALRQVLNKKGEVTYSEEFELAQNSDGESILIWFLDCVISSNRMNDTTIMRQIEHTQTARGSRKSTVENPLMFIIYLPTHTGSSIISLLQKTLKKFLHDHQLWKDYNIEYSNSMEDTGDSTQEYDVFIKNIMDNTKKEKKRGCILLLGNKGSVGVTYSYCDVTISMDNGQDLDSHKQRLARALTDAERKTIGINVDMNVQRVYKSLMDVVHRHKLFTNTTQTYAEILYYLFHHNIFLFDPQCFHQGLLRKIDIQSFYTEEAKYMIENAIDDTSILESLNCDGDPMRNILQNIRFKSFDSRKINLDLEGEQPDCPKGELTKLQVDPPEDIVVKSEQKEEIEEVEVEEDDFNKTEQLCKSLIPLLAFISKAYNIFDFKKIFGNRETMILIGCLLKNKKIELNKSRYYNIVKCMNNIIDNNPEIVNNIREIYRIAPSHKLRELIEKHFIPSAEEKKELAEVSSPIILLNDMFKPLVSLGFFKIVNPVFEPCCGKGNIVIALFDLFFEGLERLFPDEIERCCIIMTKCIYYADINRLNVFITTEILKCHIQSKCGVEQINYQFNYNVGNTLNINIQEKWKLSGFKCVAKNAPYNSNGDTGTGNTLWQEFTKKSLNEWLLPNGYLLAVHPPGWRKPNSERGRFSKMFEMMTKENQMVYLEMHGVKDGQKIFHCGTRYDWYLIQKKEAYKDTIIIDEENKKMEMDLRELTWLPNSNVSEILDLLVKNGDMAKCPIIQSMSAYEPRKKWMAITQSTDYPYPCVHSTPKSGVRYKYSSVNDRGHFGISKVIFGDSGIYNPIIDMDGIYGMTQHAMAIQVDSLEEAQNIVRAICSPKFNKVIHSCMFSSFAIDWNIFKDFRKDFWREFL